MVTGSNYMVTVQKRAFMEGFLYIVDKRPDTRLITINPAQRFLFDNWATRMIVCKSRQLGISTGILADFFVDAISIPNLVVAVVSHEEFATQRLLTKIDTFHKHLPDDIRPPMYHNSAHEKSFPNGSTIYIGTAGSRAFGRGDTIHRCLVSEEAHYQTPEKILSGLQEAVPIDGVLIRESTPLGDSGYYYDSIQECLEGESVYKLLPLYWWLGEDYRIPRGSEFVHPDDREQLNFTPRELELILSKGLTEDQIRWRRWKIRTMRSENKDNLFPQEYIEDLETCFLGELEGVFDEVKTELLAMSLNCKDPTYTEDVAEIWRPPEAGATYIFWVDPCGGESVTSNDPHDGVILKLHAGGLEHVASIYSRMEQKPFAEKVNKWGRHYNNAKLIVERNGVGKGVLNYLVNDYVYPNLYCERKKSGEVTWGFYTDAYNKGKLVSDCLYAIRNSRVVTYDRKVVRQARALINKNGKIAAKPPARDDRIMAFMGAISMCEIAGISTVNRFAVGDYVSFGGR